jgi:hypothetical protein
LIVHTGVWLIAAPGCGLLRLVTRIARAALEILRLTVARETLGAAGASAAGGPRRKPLRFLRLLFANEPLPMDPPAPPRRRHRSIVALLAPEPLPHDDAPPAAHRPSWLAALLAPEPLPHDPAPRAPRRRSRLAALFAPEKLDDSD